MILGLLCCCFLVGGVLISMDDVSSDPIGHTVSSGDMIVFDENSSEYKKYAAMIPKRSTGSSTEDVFCEKHPRVEFCVGYNMR